MTCALCSVLRIPTARRLALRLLPCLLLLAVVVAVPAGAVCVYNDLTSGAPRVTTNLTEYERFNQQDVYWAALGVRGNGDDWDAYLYQSPDAIQCVTTPLASSTRIIGVDFVVGDFNHVPTGVYYAEALNFTAGSNNATVEWDSGVDLLLPNGPAIERSMASSDLLECWDVLLEGGRTYRINLERYGSADVRVCIFRNPSNNPYWTNRSGAALEASGPADYTPPQTDYYGVVVFNNNGGSGSYLLSIGDCQTPQVLASDVAAFGPGQSNLYTFQQPHPYWAVVGTRPSNLSDDYDVEVDGSAAGNPWPKCVSDSLAGSILGAGLVDLVVGDFNYNANQTYAARSHLYRGVGSLGGEWTEFEGGGDLLRVNADLLNASMDATDIVRCWDVWLDADQPYEIYFNQGGSLGPLTCLVFENPASGSYWAPRSWAAFTAKTTATYTPSRSGWHGVVVVNDEAVTRSFAIGVRACLPIQVLADGLPVYSRMPVDFLRFDQGVAGWSTLAFRRPVNGLADVGIFTSPTGDSPPTCFSGTVTQAGWGADPNLPVCLYVGDFHPGRAATGTYYLRTGSSAWPYTVPARLEWEGDASPLTVGAPPVNHNTSDGDLIQVYEPNLQAGQFYSVYFQSFGTARLQWYLIAPIDTPPYWTGSPVANGLGSGGFTAPKTGSYALIVVAESEGTTLYKLALYAGGVDVPGGPTPAVTAFRGVVPNPGQGSRRLDFDLREPAQVAFEVLDVAGRRVGSVPLQAWPMGSWSASWDGRAASGDALPAGIYFVRMLCQGREVGRSKVAIVD